MAVVSDNEKSFYKNYAPFPVIGGGDGNASTRTFVDKFPEVSKDIFDPEHPFNTSFYSDGSSVTDASAGAGASASGSGSVALGDSYDPNTTTTGEATKNDSRDVIDPFKSDLTDTFDADGSPKGGGITDSLSTDGGLSSSSSWWNDAFKKLWNYAARFGLIIIAVVLLAAGAWALASEKGLMPTVNIKP